MESLNRHVINFDMTYHCNWPHCFNCPLKSDNDCTLECLFCENYKCVTYCYHGIIIFGSECGTETLMMACKLLKQYAHSHVWTGTLIIEKPFTVKYFILKTEVWFFFLFNILVTDISHFFKVRAVVPILDNANEEKKIPFKYHYTCLTVLLCPNNIGMHG